MSLKITAKEQVRRLEVSLREALKILEEDRRFASLDARRVLKDALEKSQSRSVANVWDA